jgi:hypothetical protein
MIVLGIVVTATSVVDRDNCNQDMPPAVCQGYTTTIHWSYLLIVGGAVFFIGAALSATNLVQRPDRESDAATTREDSTLNTD